MKIRFTFLFGALILVGGLTSCDSDEQVYSLDQPTNSLEIAATPISPTATWVLTATSVPTTVTPTLTPIPPFEILIELFEYDREQPLNIEILEEETRDSVVIQSLKYNGAESPNYHKPMRVTAYLVLPDGNGPFPAVFYLHAGGMSKDQYLDEAIFLAKQKVVCLLIDGPLSSIRSSRLDPFDWQNVRTYYIRTVIDVRRGIDLFESLPQVNPNKIGYVGHSYGATWAGVIAGVETRIKAYVIMAGAVEISKLDTPEVPELDAIRYLSYAAPTSYLFQFAEDDVFIDHDEAQLYFDSANEPKSILWYDTDHFTLQHVGQTDRLRWLSKQLGFYLRGLP